MLGVQVLDTEQDLDFSLDGPLPLKWQRCYRSTNTRAGWFGPGWSSALEVSLQSIADPTGESVDHVACVDVFGRHIRFPYLPPGGSHFATSEKLSLLRSHQGQYRLATADGRSFWFNDRIDGTHRLAALTDRNGNATHMDYREADGQIETVYVSCSGKQHLELHFVGSRLREVTQQRTAPHGVERVTLMRYEYSVRGELCRVINRANECMRSFDYNPAGLIAHQTYAGTLESWFEYTGSGADAKVAKHWDNVGQRWTFDYQKHYTTVVEHDGRSSIYHIDSQKRLVAYTDPLGQTTHFGLDRAGNMRAVIDPAGNVTETVFDERGNPVESRDATGAATTVEWHPVFERPVAVTDPLNRTTRYEYDARGNLIMKAAPDGAQTHYKLDERGLRIAVVDAKGGISKLQYNDAGQVTQHTDCSQQVTRYEYDDNGFLTARIDALGQRTAFMSDAVGRLRRMTLPDGTHEEYESDLADRLLSVTDALGARTTYRYAPDGLMVEQTDALGHTQQYRYSGSRKLTEIVNENGARWQCRYDLLDRVTEQRGFDGTRLQYVHDAAGFLASSVDAPDSPQAIVTRYRRDVLGRLLERSNAAGSVTFTYDPAGQLTQARNHGVEVHFKYDKAGRINEESITALERTHTLKHAYDPLGNRISTLLPDGTAIATLYYGSRHAHQILIDDEPVLDFERDALHREVVRTQGKLTTRRQYDPADRLLRQTARADGDAAVDPLEIDRRYVYDEVGRLTSAADRGRQLVYGYDAIEQLTRFNDECFAFDPAHNMLPGTAAEPTVAAPVLDDRLPAYEDKRYRYDAHGRLVEKILGDGTVIQLRWNDEHQLVESVRHDAQGQHVTEYLYDPFGRRALKRSPSGTTWFTWDEDRLVHESGVDDQRTFLYEPGRSFAPLAELARARVPDGQPVRLRYYHCDQAGLPRELTDPAGELAWEATYRGWGRLSSEQALAAASPLRYQGQYFDAETGLHYNLNRYYDPDCGRFISRDPIGLMGGFNAYRYGPNPVLWIDPTGLTGTYIMSGGPTENYIGKGPKERSQASRRERIKKCPNPVVVHKDYGDDDTGFMVEHKLMEKYGARLDPNWANSPKLNSPGAKKYAAATPAVQADIDKKADELAADFEAQKAACGLP